MTIPFSQVGTPEKFYTAGFTRHVSARTLTSITPPGSVLKAFHHSNLDKPIWLESYKEEYDGLLSNDTFDIISEAEYQCLKQIHGVCAILSMYTFVVKHTNSVPTRAKSCIVVLGNLEHRTWTKANCFSPVISIPMICLLTSMAVQNRSTLKQADRKFVFIQASLPSEEHTVVKPPLGCPFSKPCQYWRLKKSLYGL
jgi:hypothetical protein